MSRYMVKLKREMVCTVEFVISADSQADAEEKADAMSKPLEEGDTAEVEAEHDISIDWELYSFDVDVDEVYDIS